MSEALIASVYWQPGCTSCLRAKEFLTRHNIPYRSRNVLADETAYDELMRFGIRRVPIVSLGDRWVDGQSLRDIAALVGIHHIAATQYGPVELVRRCLVILDGAARFLGQITDDALETTVLPNRPRSLTQLGFHLFNVVDAFVEHEEGTPLVFASYCREPQTNEMSKDELLRYGLTVKHRMTHWRDTMMATVDWRSKADVYYAEQSRHDFLERTVWHAGQHTRQLMWMMADTLNIDPDCPLGVETFGGLPMPERVWDAA
jgi:glutaredoxin